MTGLNNHPVKSLYSAEAGNAALEIAVVLPVVFVLVFSLIDASRLFILHSILQTSSSAVALQFETGAVTEGQLKDQTFGISEQIAAGWIDKSLLSVSRQALEADPPAGAYLQIEYDARGEIASLLSLFAKEFYQLEIRQSAPGDET